MRIAAKLTAIAAFVLVAGCEVNVDNNLEASVENQADALGQDLESAASDAGNTIEGAADAVGDQMDAIGDNIDIDINLNADGDEAAANTQ
ncbi:hypothetical protein [Sphingosinicella rhizophila]|uniref:Uncharacterized protein n=1 Tax=Sphingosinicella rhizophila TaxID=3050082 RepID=A0ABU3QAW9_9SPHN|nr:hypothetical protein [Sphingosinicella sp. GR2756]MDT9600555.1 hypothetical protein [Sphingosinicella sp. GR2756]